MWDFLIYPSAVKQRAIEKMMAVYNSCGVTSCREMGLSVNELDAYSKLRRTDRMTVRVNALLGLPARYLDVEEITSALSTYFGPMQGFGDDWLRIGGLKMVMHNDGYWSLSREKMEALLYSANSAGWTMAIHVGSPEAAELVLELLAEAHKQRPIDGRRFSIEHRYQRFDPDAYRQLAEWGVTIAANPQLTYRAAGRALQMHQAMNEVRIMKGTDEDGWQRAVRWYSLALRDWWDAGINVTGGTDNPAVAYEVDRPLLGFYQAVTGDTEAGVLLPGQELTPREALRAFTMNNAFGMFEEGTKGSLEIGKVADLVVLDQNPLQVTPEKLLETRVALTMVDGRVVFER
jgi:predicted amidohydrolase YtcJ